MPDTTDRESHTSLADVLSVPLDFLSLLVHRHVWLRSKAAPSGGCVGATDDPSTWDSPLLLNSTQRWGSAATYARNDRLTLPTLPGLYGHFALGSRGLLWSMLGAEVLAAMIDGGASPLEGDLLQAIDPSRFVRQRLRRALPI